MFENFKVNIVTYTCIIAIDSQYEIEINAWSTVLLTKYSNSNFQMHTSLLSNYFITHVMMSILRMILFKFNQFD